MVGYAQGEDDYDIASDGEEFNEDTLDDDEYEQLYAQLPLLKKELESYNDEIQEIDMKEALYFNYYKINESVEELKDKYPKKKKSMYTILTKQIQRSGEVLTLASLGFNGSKAIRLTLFSSGSISIPLSSRFETCKSAKCFNLKF